MEINIEKVLTKEERAKLRLIGKDTKLIGSALNHIQNKIIKEMLWEWVSQEYAKWAIFILSSLGGLFK